MAKSGGIGPNKSTAPRQSLQNQQTLQDKEQKAKTQRGRKLSARDQARLVSQAGFSRQKKGPKKGFDIGDGASQPYALPEDEVDGEIWSQERLESAQGSLSLASSQFEKIAKAETEGASLGAHLVQGSFTPSEEDLEEMQQIAQQQGSQPLPVFQQIHKSVSSLFGIELTEDIPIAHQILAAGLVVAGETHSVQLGQGKLQEQPLADGLQKVTKRGNQAVAEAQRLNRGVNEKLNVQRTFMFRR